MGQDLLKNGFKTSLLDKRPMIGLWCTLDGDTATEVAAVAGYDWLLFDTEHTPSSDRDVLRKLQTAAAYPVFPVVRPSSNDRVRIKRLLDIGVQTLLIPYVESEAEAIYAVEATRYPPTGKRGVAGAMRAARYGTIPSYQARANDEICVLVQIESRAGLDNLEAIAAVEGVDGVFVGPADLAANCGLKLPEDSAELRKTIESAFERIHKVGKPIGILSTVESDARHYLDLGATFVAVGVDTSLLMRSSADLAKRFKE